MRVAEPDRIDIAPDIYAIRLYRHYVLKFPFDREANDRVRRAIGAHFDRASGGWCLDAHRPDLVRRVLGDVAAILAPRRTEACAPGDVRMPAVDPLGEVSASNVDPNSDPDPDPVPALF